SWYCEKRWPLTISVGSAATTASRSGSRWLPRSMIDSSSLSGLVEGISARAAAVSVTPQSASTSKVRLSVATTDSGGTSTVWVPLLSSTSTVPAAADSSPAAASLSPEEVPQAVRTRPRAPAVDRAPKWRRVKEAMDRTFSGRLRASSRGRPAGTPLRLAFPEQFSPLGTCFIGRISPCGRCGPGHRRERRTPGGLTGPRLIERRSARPGGAAQRSALRGAPAAGEQQRGGDRQQPAVLGDGRAVLAGAHAVGLGEPRGAQVHRHHRPGERRQAQPRDPRGHEGQQQRGAHGDLAVAEELRELLGGELAQRRDAVGGHPLQPLGRLGGQAELADAGVEDERAGDGAEDGGAQ